MRWIISEVLDEEGKFDARSKARKDMENIMVNNAIRILPVHVSREKKLSLIGSLVCQIKISSGWSKAIKVVKPGDTVYMQFMPAHYVFTLGKHIKKLNAKGAKVVTVVHDLDWLRNDKNIGRKRKIIDSLAKKCLPLVYRVVAHNENMRKYLINDMHLEEKRVLSLDIFDYLIPDRANLYKLDLEKRDNTVIIAGNLTRRAGYVYHLPQDVRFRLYGMGYQPEGKENVEYLGKFLPDELPLVLKGTFGLVWDGPKAETCYGYIGEYLKYNNPHKASLYLASGIPIIIWSEAALSQFVLENQCGVVIGSLEEISSKITSISDEDYKKLKQNAVLVGKRLTDGYYTKKIIEQCQ